MHVVTHKPRFETRSIAMEHPTWYGVWDTARKMFLPNQNHDGPFKFKDWAIAEVACSMLNAAYPFPHPDFNGGETWMEDFVTLGLPSGPALNCVTCGTTGLDAENKNLREQLETAYQHIEECGK